MRSLKDFIQLNSLKSRHSHRKWLVLHLLEVRVGPLSPWLFLSGSQSRGAGTDTDNERIGLHAVLGYENAAVRRK